MIKTNKKIKSTQKEVEPIHKKKRDYDYTTL